MGAPSKAETRAGPGASRPGGRSDRAHGSHGSRPGEGARRNRSRPSGSPPPWESCATLPRSCSSLNESGRTGTPHENQFPEAPESRRSGCAAPKPAAQARPAGLRRRTGRRARPRRCRLRQLVECQRWADQPGRLLDARDRVRQGPDSGLPEDVGGQRGRVLDLVRAVR